VRRAWLAVNGSGIASSSVRLRAAQQYSSDRQLGSLEIDRLGPLVIDDIGDVYSIGA
jgi:hypothetical protein